MIEVIGQEAYIAIKFIYLACYKYNSRNHFLYIIPAHIITICEGSGLGCRKMDDITLYSFNIPQ